MLIYFSQYKSLCVHQIPLITHILLFKCSNGIIISIRYLYLGFCQRFILIFRLKYCWQGAHSIKQYRICKVTHKNQLNLSILFWSSNWLLQLTALFTSSFWGHFEPCVTILLKKWCVWGLLRWHLCMFSFQSTCHWRKKAIKWRAFINNFWNCRLYIFLLLEVFFSVCQSAECPRGGSE